MVRLGLKKDFSMNYMMISTLFLSLWGALHAHQQTTAQLSKNLTIEQTSVQQQKYQKTGIFYQIIKDGQICGYLFGTLHAGISDTHCQKRKAEIAPFIKQCKKIYFEVDVTFAQDSMEGVICQLLQDRSEIKYECFETAAFQRAYLSSLYWSGSSLQLTPWHSYWLMQQFPEDIEAFNEYWARSVQWKNRLISEVESDDAVNKNSEKVLSEWVTIEQNYQEHDIVESFSDFESQYLFMKERNHTWMHRMLKNQKSDDLYCIIVGAGHLPGDDGLVALFEKNGYQCKRLLENR